MVNQRDVAKRAGVSSASVSRYINNPASISLKTANKIKNAIKELGYRPNFTAKSLKTGKFQRVGIISAAKGPFYWEVLDSIEESLFESGYFINVSITRKSEFSKMKTLQLVKNRQVDGVIIFPLLNQNDDEIVKYLKDMGDKFVVLDRPYEDESIYQVSIDNYEAGKTAARTFLDRGHRDFLFIWGVKDVVSAHERFRGFQDELKTAGIILNKEMQIDGEFSAKKTYEITKKILPKLPKFTAVFASNDQSAIGFMKAAYENGLITPNDYSIIGFDDMEFAPYVTPSLTTFRQPVQTMGKIAAEMLISQIEGREIRDTRVLLKARLLIRDSIKAIF